MSELLKCKQCESQAFTLHKNGPHVQAVCADKHAFGTERRIGLKALKLI